MLLLAPLVSAALAQAQTQSVQLDPARTTIQFAAGSVRRVHGSFQLKGSTFALNSQTGIAQGEILVDPLSEKSNSAKLDAKLKNETLEADKYPTIFFHPEKVMGALPAGNGESTVKLQGSFNIHGADHSLTVEVHAVRSGEDYTFTTSFLVPYVQWGMKDASTLLMRDKQIRITMESHGSVTVSEPKI